MIEQERNESGLFISKSDSPRKPRAIRLTDKVWDELGDKADENDMSRADYLEALFEGQLDWEGEESESEHDFDVDEVAEVLKEVFQLNSRQGVRMKELVKQALELMGIDPQEED